MQLEDVFYRGFISLLFVMTVALLALLGITFFSFLTGTNQSTDDITSSYSLPDELAGCRVYRMVPAGFGQMIYVVSRDGEPKATRWDAGHAKNRHSVEVVTP